MSGADKAAVRITRAIAEPGRWTRSAMLAYTRGFDGDSSATYEALARAQARGWVEHVAATATEPELWQPTEAGRRRAARV